MVKRILSLLGIVGILSTMMVTAAFAAPLEVDDDDTLITGLSADLGTFNFAGGDTMNVTFSIKDTVELSSIEAAILNNEGDLTEATDDVLVYWIPPVAMNVGACNAGLCPVTFSWGGNTGLGTIADGTNYYFGIYAANAAHDSDVDYADFDVSTTATLNINSVTATTPWDPAVDGNLNVGYTLNKAASTVVTFLDGTTTLKTVNVGSALTGSASWDGKVSGDFVVPGTYTAKVVATVGQETDTETKNVVVTYTDALAPELTEFAADPTAFKADDGETTVSFTLNHSASLTVNIVDVAGNVVFTPADYDGSEEESSGSVSFEWDGTKINGDVVDKGLYYVEVTARNNNGVAFDDSLVLDVDSDGSTYIDGTAKIKNIDLDPSASSSSNAWDPLEEDLSVDWELMDDFDSIKIEMRKGSTVVEAYEEDDLEADDYDTKIEGQDDDGEWLESGTWKLIFLGEIEDKTYYVEKSFVVKYDEPEIEDTFVTKSEIDPDLGEGVYFGFMLNDDALVDVEVYKDGKSKVDLLEEEELKADVWYAVYWDGLDEDGDDFKYDDSFKILLTARSLGDEDIYDTASEAVDLDEDDVSSSKANVTLDSLTPPVVEQGDSVTFTYTLEEEAEVRVAIWKGTSTSGSADVELQDYKVMDAGTHTLVWNGKDSSGNTVKEGFYSYKVFAKKDGSSSTETESGKIAIEDLGEVFGGPSESTSVDEPVVEEEEEEEEEDTYECGFRDVLTNNTNCDAITWSLENGVFFGDPDGNFRPYSTINRAEVLAVVMRAFALPVYADDGTNLGWSDVVIGEWYMPYLRSGKDLGLLAGDAGATTVRPEAGVSRVELLKFIYESAKKTGMTVGVCTMNPYADVFMGEWYTDYVCQSKINGLFDVVGDLFGPAAMASRGEVAEALYRVMDGE